MRTLLDAKQLPAIKQAVLRVEQRYARKYDPSTGEGERAFLTNGPRGAIYAPVPEDEFLQHLGSLKLDRALRFAVLGAGFGMDSFCAATWFEEVVGFEIDPEICQEAETTRQAFGISNVRFAPEDFTKADLSSFRAVAFYMPFTDNFNRLMGRTLARLSPGTIAISHAFDNSTLFNLRYFTDYDGIPEGEFYTYVRNSKT